MNEQTTTRTTIRLQFNEVPGYLQRYAVEVDAWAREAGGRPVLQTGSYPAI
jgi:hypothetical protein